MADSVDIFEEGRGVDPASVEDHEAFLPEWLGRLGGRRESGAGRNGKRPSPIRQGSGTAAFFTTIQPFGIR
ncbi:hypothetical protein [Planctomyces sp. SH-PL62]|uniref:hypothetical protein n=1 Tax=Planctomyces sp. SH-PL62 TaxID=1636152 RepID=UPI00078C12FB|nr:hypothetical protein [Planctomyces sp. SH-PL62]AMV38610.1 hypothetical protein VT85_14325 [Planctomyces sp. SH-PL62]